MELIFNAMFNKQTVNKVATKMLSFSKIYLDNGPVDLI
jgi:hypothetical protein